jgi:hypothetical protein
MSSVHSIRNSAGRNSSGHNPVGRLAADHPGFVKAGRVGWFAKGAVYVVAGVLSLLIAARSSGWADSASTGTQEASPTGALKAIAHETAGPLLLVLLAIGMLLYAAWRVVSALMPGGTDAEAWVRRIGFVVSAVIYTTFAVTALALARSRETSGTNGNSTVNKDAGGVMSHTGGRLLIGIVGVIVIAAGVYRIAKGVKVDVDDELDLTGMSNERRRWTERLGALGEVGRGVGIGLIGFFLLRAAITYDPSEATGLDGALRTLVTKTGGLLVVLLVGIGFVAYGLFCLATFTRRRLEAP